MRVDRLHVLAYGPFTDEQLDLSAGTEGLHVVYGPNEAGKSSMLRALIAWLFGMDRRTRDDFLHRKKDLAIEGTLRLSDGQTLTFRRLKSDKVPLQDPHTGRPLPETVLMPFLGSMDKKTFNLLYGVDYERLRRGGRALLELEGKAKDIVFSAAAGLADMSRIKEEFEKKLTVLYRVQGQKQHINKALSDYKSLHKSLGDDMEKLSLVEQRRAAMERIERELPEIEEQLASLGQRIERARRVQVTGPMLGQLRGIEEELAKLSHLPNLPDDFGNQVQDARRQIQENQVKLDQSNRHMQDLRKRMDDIELDPRFSDPLLAERIREFQDRLGAADKSESDLGRRRGELEKKRDEARRVLGILGLDCSLEEGNRRFGSVMASERTIRSLLAKRQELQKDRDRLASELREIDAEWKAADKEHRLLVAQRRDIGVLARLVQDGSPDRGIEGDVAELEADLDEKQKVLQQELSKLGRLEGDLETFAGLALPSKEALKDFETDWGELGREEQELERARSQAEDARDKALSILQDDSKFEEIPRIQDLVDARGRRDELWARIKTSLLEPAPEGGGISSDGSQVQDVRSGAFGPDRDGASLALGLLLGDYERQVGETDRIADVLREHAEVVEKRSSIESEIEQANESIASLEEKLSELRERRSRWEEQWRKFWLDRGLVPGKVDEMQSWLDAALRLRERLGDLEGPRAQLARKRARLSLRMKELADALVDWGFEKDQAPSLSGLLAQAEELVEAEKDREQRIGQLGERLAELEQKRARMERELEDRERDLSNWRKSWIPHAESLGLGPDCGLDEVEDRLDLVRKFLSAMNEIANLENRINGMEKDLEQFARDLAVLVGDLGEEIGSEDPKDCVRRLLKAFQDNQNAEEIRRELADTLKQEEAQRNLAALTLAQAEKSLEDLCRRGHVPTPESLDPLLVDLVEKRRLEQRRDEVRQSLHEQSQGRTIEELDAEMQAYRDQNPAEALNEMEAERQQLQERKERMLAERGELKEAERRQTGDASLADRNQKLVDLAEDIAISTREYVRLLFAKEILAQVVDQYFQEHKGPALERASEYFSRMTLGAFVGIDLARGFDERRNRDSKEDIPLLGIRAGSKDLVEPVSMSDGTRDQLYLALRLATAVEYMKDSEPMPLILDDLLVGFDDARTRATLEVFGDLAARTQVLVFTHHEAVMQAAESLDVPAGSFVHRLTHTGR